jgi:[ribosomal protein S5]-alanine N-acetyltransferase
MTSASEVRPPESFSTRRLSCRIPLLADVAVIFRSYTQDPEVTRYLGWLPHISADETRAFIERCLRGWETDGPFAYCICQIGWTDPIGMIQMKVDGHQVNLGYVLARQHWGKGLMPGTARFNRVRESARSAYHTQSRSSAVRGNQ